MRNKRPDARPLRSCWRDVDHIDYLGYLDDLIIIDSPNRLHTLTVTINELDEDPRWEDQKFQVVFGITKHESSADRDDDGAEELKPRGFALTWFDFPVTDNTLLGDGTRFAITLDHVEVNPEYKKVTLTLIWFPEDYFSARERPTNYQQLREKLGLKPNVKF